MPLGIINQLQIMANQQLCILTHVEHDDKPKCLEGTQPKASWQKCWELKPELTFIVEGTCYVM